MTGAPTTTPSAYTEMTWPAVGMSTPTPSAMSGRTPMVTNSVVPIANPPIASATTATTTRTVLIGAGGAVTAGSLTHAAKCSPGGRIPGVGAFSADVARV